MPQEAADRLVKNQLGLKLVEISSSPIGIGVAGRDSYKLHMEDHDALSYEGEFNLDQKHYIDWKWVNPRKFYDLVKKEHEGQMGECTRILLKTYGLL